MIFSGHYSCRPKTRKNSVKNLTVTLLFTSAQFNSRCQEPDEPVETFVTALYNLAEHCGYEALHDEMICDRIVVGIQDRKLSEKLQLDPALTLEKAIITVRQVEAVKKQ